MDAAKCRVKGSDFNGVFCTASDNLIFGPLHLTKKEHDILTSTLHVEVLEISIAESSLVGLFSRINSNGILLSNLATDEEVTMIKEKAPGINVGVLHSDINAIGSNVLANDKIAIVNHEYQHSEMKQIGDVLGVEVVKSEIGGYRTVGANNILTNSGLVINNRAADFEEREWEGMTKFKTIRTTANTGALAIGLAVVANSKGVVAGEATTGFELNRIIQGLDHNQ
jgi:translation initiation factor 6